MKQIQDLFDNNILIYIMVGLCGMGLLVKFLIQIIYNNLMNASDNMANSKNKLMKLVKMKFEACYKLKIGVSNVDIFVDKYIYKYKFCGILLYTWENISGQILILCLLTGAVGAGLAVYYDCGKSAILSTFFIGLLTSALLIVFESFINLQAKRNIIRVNMKDYLENMFKVRLEQEYIYPEKLEAYRNEYFDTEEKQEEIKEFKEKRGAKEIKEIKEKSNYISNQEDKLVQSVPNETKQKTKLEDTAVTKEIELEKMVEKTVDHRNSYKRDELCEKKEKILKNDNKSTKFYQINRDEEEVIEDILKEFMA